MYVFLSEVNGILGPGRQCRPKVCSCYQDLDIDVLRRNHILKGEHNSFWPGIFRIKILTL